MLKNPFVPSLRFFSNFSYVKLCFLIIQHKSKHSQKYSSVEEEIIWTYSDKNAILGSSGEKKKTD